MYNGRARRTGVLRRAGHLRRDQLDRQGDRHEVVAVAIDLGQGGEDMEVVRQRALDCGAVEAVVVDARDEFAERVLPARHPGQRAVHGPLPAGVGAQPAADRQAPREAAREHGGGIVAHGCTGKGNDQVRFEVGSARWRRTSR